MAAAASNQIKSQSSNNSSKSQKLSKEQALQAKK